MKSLLITWLFLSFSTQALELPNPLTLRHTLALATKQNLEQKQLHINIELDKIELKSYQDSYKTTVDLDLQLARRDNEKLSGTDYSHAFIKINKVLYDQNVEINQNAAKSTVKNTEFALQQLKIDKTTQVMQAFFNIILADMRHETVLERLAISAIRANRIQDNFDVEDASEVELLEKRTLTQLDVVKRIEAEAAQITTRAKLAQLLNIAYENRPDNLVKPDLTYFFKKELAGFEIWQKKIQLSNLELGELRRVLANLKQQRNLEKNNKEIVISSNIKLGEQSYDSSKNGNWRAGISFIMPFGQSQSQKNKTSKLLTKIKQQQLRIEQRTQALNQQALSLWLKLKTLKQRHQALTTELDYRDLYLELARANYEMEIKSDIGSAMSNLTDTEWKLTKNEFDFVIVFIQLQQLAGEDYEL
jgi:outer membrane protein TolC